MTNREYLIKNTNPYDLLCRMQKNLVRGDLSRCILDIITGTEEDCYSDKCQECIAKWLNELYKGGNKNAQDSV